MIDQETMKTLALLSLIPLVCIHGWLMAKLVDMILKSGRSKDD